jgi:hypothetical protein
MTMITGTNVDNLINHLHGYASEAKPFDERMYDDLMIAIRMLELLTGRVGILRESSVDLLTAGDMLFEALRTMYEGCIDDDLNSMSEEALMAWDKAKYAWSGES